MKKLFSLLLLSLALITSTFAQVPDTTTAEKKARYKITKIKDNTIRAITPNDFRGAFSAVADMAAGRIPFVSMDQLRAGKADTASVVFVTDATRSGNFIYDKTDVTSVDDSLYIVRVGAKRYVRQQPANQWTGKKIIYTGTSIPWSFAPNSYPTQLGKLLGATVINNSISGSTIIFKAPDGAGDLGSYGMSGTYAELIAAGFSQNYSYENRIMPYPDADLIFIDHGTNDWSRIQTSLGTINGTDKSTFYGAFNAIINAVHAARPRARIVLVTPPNAWVYGGEGSAQTQRENMQAIGAAIRAIGINRGLPVCDLMSLCGITSKNVTYWTSDGLHPNPVMAKKIAQILYRFTLTLN
jgi:lysophospholipase L1-like esterase